MNPITNILDKYPLIILDGAFSTELERKGCDLNDPLWSAKILVDNPGIIEEVHTDYLKSGADCIITASYQATYEGFEKRGFSEQEAGDLIRYSVKLATNARDHFWNNNQNEKNRPKPLVAASVGPYGAFLADGSEYRGDYNLDIEELKTFHRKRFETLIDAGPDILACETIPCLDEAKALTELLLENSGTSGWISFSAKDGKHINSGEKISECAQWLDNNIQVAAVGINCTAPEYVSSLIDEIRKGTDKPIIIYPNSGESYDAENKTWHGSSAEQSYGKNARFWYEKGAKIIGGCCRTTPEDIKEINNWGRNLL